MIEQSRLTSFVLLLARQTRARQLAKLPGPVTLRFSRFQGLALQRHNLVVATRRSRHLLFTPQPHALAHQPERLLEQLREQRRHTPAIQDRVMATHRELKAVRTAPVQLKAE